MAYAALARYRPYSRGEGEPVVVVYRGPNDRDAEYAVARFLRIPMRAVRNELRHLRDEGKLIVSGQKGLQARVRFDAEGPGRYGSGVVTKRCYVLRGTLAEWERYKPVRRMPKGRQIVRKNLARGGRLIPQNTW